MMALILQNSTGTVSGANAYLTVAAFKAYHDSRGNDYAGKTDDQIAAAIVRGTDFIDTRFSFRGIKQPNGVRATGTLTATGQFSDGETLTISGLVYTFHAVPSLPNDVRIGGSLAASLANIAKAINGTGVAGTDYGVGTQAHGSVGATSDATTLSLTAAQGGVDGNNITTTETCANASFGGATLSGGAAQTTEWPRMASTDVLPSVFDDFASPILLDVIAGSIVLLVGPDGLQVVGIPPAVERACAEYALRALSAPLFQDAPAPEGGNLIKEHDVTVDVISEHTKYEQAQSGSFVMPAFPQADLWLSRAGLLTSSTRMLTR
jgi:hypothetical protein